MKRFNDYLDITAKFNSTGTCGHTITKGDSIGYARAGRGKAETQCSDCWKRWSLENQEEELLEWSGVA